MKIHNALSLAFLLEKAGSTHAVLREALEEASSVDDADVDAACTCGNGKVKIWGPGGPHTALIPVAELFNAQRQATESKDEIEICFGPEHTWRDQALQCASGFMSAAEQQAAGFARTYGDILDLTGTQYVELATPITSHKATLLVVKGNPKNILDLEDILERDDVGVVVVDGNFHGTLTSGTGLWEDVLGRTKSLQDTSDFRERICHVASGGGNGRNQLVETDNGCDAWIYWNDWAVDNSDIVEDIGLPDDLAIYRDLSVMPTTNEGGEVVKEFIEFALVHAEANAVMQEAGWYREWP